MKFEATIEARMLNAVLKAVHVVSYDCVFNISPDGLSIRVVDPSNAMMIAVDIPNDVFSKYDASEGKIGVNVDALLLKTNTYAADTAVTLVWDEYQKRINLSGDGAKWGVRSIDAETVRKPPSIPNLDLPLEVEIEAERFKRMIKRAGTVSEYVVIGFGTAEGETEETFFVSAEGDIDNFREDVSNKSPDIVIESPAVIETLYSLNMLSDIAKNLEGRVEIRLGRDMPATFDFDMLTGSATFLLAPRIEGAD